MFQKPELIRVAINSTVWSSYGKQNQVLPRRRMVAVFSPSVLTLLGPPALKKDSSAAQTESKQTDSSAFYQQGVNYWKVRSEIHVVMDKID